MTAIVPQSTWTVLVDIGQEREVQDKKWGADRHLPDGTHEDYADLARAFRDACDEHHKAGEGTWLDILLEEVYEAATERDMAKLRKELIQVAAVCCAWAEDLDSRAVGQ